MGRRYSALFHPELMGQGIKIGSQSGHFHGTLAVVLPGLDVHISGVTDAADTAIDIFAGRALLLYGCRYLPVHFIDFVHLSANPGQSIGCLLRTTDTRLGPLATFTHDAHRAVRTGQ
jgi:hypothetical protein